MPIDTSIYRNNQQRNPIQDMGAVVGMANQANQNRLFQQQFGSNIAAGEAYRGAIQPDGTLDTNRLMQSLAGGPAAYTLPQVMKGVQEQRQRQVGIETNKFELTSKRLGALRSALGSVLANPQATAKDVIAATSQLVAQQIITPQMAATSLSGMPQDDEGRRRWLTENLVNTMDAQQKLNAAYGTPEMMEGVDQNTGAQTKTPIAMSPLTGARRLPIEGQGNQLMGAPQQQGGIPIAQPQPPAQEGAFVTGLPPGQQEAMEGSSKAWQALRDDVGQSAERVFTLNQALDALGKADTGKGSDWQNDIKSYAITLGWNEDLKDAGKVAAYDKANKYLTQYAMRQSAGLGSGTDSKLAAAITGNASTEISNLAAKDVVKANIALERMKQAQALSFEELGLAPSQFSDWAVKWNRDIDPRAFTVDLISPAKRKTLLASLKGIARKKFVSGVTMAINSGLIEADSLAVKNAN